MYNIFIFECLVTNLIYIQYLRKMPILCFDYLDWKNGLVQTREKQVKIRVAVFLVNIVITPFVLVGFSLYTYLYPCVAAVFTHVMCRVLFTSDGFLQYTGRFLFTDVDFPPEPKSIGHVKLNAEIEWKRTRDISVQSNGVKIKGKSDKLKEGTMNKLFEDGIDAADICQGQLGDCWLLCALAGNFLLN